ncbi:peptidylprolyl isomerase [Mesobacterium pallidum]|uniref:peptidylprolyl isomerase n=1 Tax=Mesobacterium pallidum TaxID=2872037 RepID=UPI001EE22AB8|nr:peptidylprolyl isomerase [Mesobacterium pallidum]
MNSRTKSLLAGAVMATLVTPAWSENHGGASADMVVATVNGAEITLGHMILVRETLPDQYRNLPDNVLWDGILDQLVQQQLLAQTQKTESRRVEVALENEHRGLLAAQAVEGVANAAVNEEAVRAAYEEMYAAEQGQEFNASHILVETEEEAAALLAELDGGADFAALARDKSTGPSGPNGGELGWFGEGMMVAPFETAVLQMSVGEVAGPVQTQFGWHVIKLNDKREKAAPELDQVRAEVESQVQQNAIQAKLAELTQAAQIEKTEVEEVDPSLLRRIELLED